MSGGAGQVFSSTKVRNPPTRSLEKTWGEVDNFEIQSIQYVTVVVVLLPKLELIQPYFTKYKSNFSITV